MGQQQHITEFWVSDVSQGSLTRTNPATDIEAFLTIQTKPF